MLEEILRGFTAGAAFAGFAETRVGVLKPGMRADVVIVDRDLFEAKPLDLLASRVLTTIIDGAVAHDVQAK